MPVYDFACATCGIQPDIVASINDDTLPCPSCGRIAARVPVYQSQGVIYKGSGFTKAVDVPRSEPEEVQDRMQKAAHNSGVTYEHTIEDIRKARIWDAEGNMSVDTTKIKSYEVKT